MGAKQEKHQAARERLDRFEERQKLLAERLTIRQNNQIVFWDEYTGNKIVELDITNYGDLQTL